MSEAPITIPTAAPNNQPKALRVMANIVSYICHPVFMPVVMAIVLYKLVDASSFTGVTPKQAGLWMISIAFSTVFMPVFSILLMKPLGFIDNYKMPTARERTIPLMTSMIFYFWISHVFASIPGNPPLSLKVLLLGNFWGIIAVFMANIFTKISMHTSAAGSMIGIIIVQMMSSSVNMVVPLFVSLVVAGLIGTSRMILHAHQRGDIWLGYILGILAQISAYIYLKP